MQTVWISCKEYQVEKNDENEKGTTMVQKFKEGMISDKVAERISFVFLGGV